ncbi:hypothetical protein QE152_g33037 [Popillia japonica]|uniref:Uncharacterized protein n=1 Tax=Popillia japonica TaxID=7064 RepID=A0AAW1IXN9_POPJA
MIHTKHEVPFIHSPNRKYKRKVYARFSTPLKTRLLHLATIIQQVRFEINRNHLTQHMHRHTSRTHSHGRRHCLDLVLLTADRLVLQYF